MTFQSSAGAKAGFRISDLKISTRVFGGFAVVVSLLAGSCVFSAWNVGRIDTAFEDYRQRNGVQRLVTDVQREFLTYRRFVREYALSGGGSMLESANKAEQSVRSAEKAAIDAVHNPERRAKLKDLDGAFDEYATLFKKMAQLRSTQDTLIQKELDPIGAKLQEEIQKLSAAGRARLNLERMELADRALDAVMTMRLHANRGIAAHHADARAQSKAAFEALLDLQPYLEVSFGGSGSEKQIAELLASSERYHKIAEDVMDRKAELEKMVDGRMAEIASTVSRIVQAVTASAQADQTAIEESTRSMIISVENMMTLFGVVGVLLAAVLAWVIGRSVSRPIVAMTTTMKQMAEGDLSVEVPSTQAHDETGEMARAVEVFKSQGLRARELERQAELARAAAEQDRLRKEEEARALAHEQACVVDKLANGLVQLSNGDLTARLDGLPDAYKQIGADFNAALSKLEETFGSIAGGSRGIHSASAEITQASDDLAKRTEQQAANLEQTAAALGELTDRVRETARGAVHAREVVMGVKADAEKSGVIVKEAIGAMDQIEKSASEISKIIVVIDEIAFQTNLLALNAGVEAARAGDAGRGFAVVASEVRALAQRSAEAAKEIKALISRSTQQVEAGVDLVGSTGAALTRIVEQVAEAASTVAGIASSANEQANGLQEVNTAVAQMDQITQQNAAMVEEATAASHSLKGEAEQLKGLIDQFRTSDSGAHVVALSTRAPVRAPRPTPASAPARKRQGAAALKTKPSHEPASDSWTEF